MSRASPATPNDGRLDKLYAFGARSFSVWSEAGALLCDSGEDFERGPREVPGDFNASNTNNAIDNRSDDKGPEPEGVAWPGLRPRLHLPRLERIGA